MEGMMIYFKDNDNELGRLDIELPDIEVIWIQLKIRNKRFYMALSTPPLKVVMRYVAALSVLSAANDAICDYWWY